MHELEHKAFGLISKYGPLLARILIGGMFLMAGISKLTGFAGTVGYIDSVGIPFATLAAVVAIVVEIVCGLGLILGYHPRYAADILILFTLVATFAFHNFWTYPESDQQIQMILFQKNFAIIGGLLYIMAFGSGPYRVGAKKKVMVES